MNEIAQKSPLERAVGLVGGQSELARRVSERVGRRVRQGTLWKWLRPGARVPTEDGIVLAIEAITRDVATGRREPDLAVTRHELRPDVYGHRPERIAA